MFGYKKQQAQEIEYIRADLVMKKDKRRCHMKRRHEKGIDFSAIDAQKVYLIMMVLFPEGKEKLHVQILARFARILKSEKTRLELKNSKSSDEIRRIFQTQKSQVD